MITMVVGLIKGNGLSGPALFDVAEKMAYISQGIPHEGATPFRALEYTNNYTSLDLNR